MKEAGLSDELYAEIETFTAAFEKDSLDQIRKMKERAELERKNSGEYEAMLNMISEICNAGRILAKGRKDKLMLADYSVKNLVKKVRMMRKASEEAEKNTTSTFVNTSVDRSPPGILRRISPLPDGF